MIDYKQHYLPVIIVAMLGAVWVASCVPPSPAYATPLSPPHTIEGPWNSYPSFIPPIVAVRGDVLWWGVPCQEAQEMVDLLTQSKFPVFDGFVSVYDTGQCVLLTGPQMVPQAERE